MQEPRENIPPTPAPVHRRRVRYAGRNPRRFAEKYKEHDPERYPEDVRKIIDSGKTPAGSHRPICVVEVLTVLAPKPGEVAVDATLGHAGHALEIIPGLLPGGKLIGLDADPLELPRAEARLLAAGIPPTAFVTHRGNFAGLQRLLAELGEPRVDIVLADLGVSSMQIDNPDRGFSFKHNGPLDMRMNPQHGRPASALLATLTERDLANIFANNADEPHADLIAAAICRARARAPISQTQQLARLVRESMASPGLNRENTDAVVRRVFQGLRVAVNEEFTALDSLLRGLPDCLKPGGRAAILTFHSGEDRRVKKSFQAGQRAGIYSDVASDVIRATPEEVRANPRAASAKLRWAVRA